MHDQTKDIDIMENSGYESGDFDRVVIPFRNDESPSHFYILQHHVGPKKETVCRDGLFTKWQRFLCEQQFLHQKSHPIMDNNLVIQNKEETAYVE